MIKNWQLFTEDKINEYYSSGIVFIYKNKILLVHPTNRNNPNKKITINDDFGKWSYPKGKANYNETNRQAAIREVAEEISVYLPNDFLDNIEEREACVKYKKDPIPEYQGLKHYIYFKYYLNDDEFKKYFNSQYYIPKEKLDLNEVDVAEFVSTTVAEKLLTKFLTNIV